jgi:hypothetical protein
MSCSRVQHNINDDISNYKNKNTLFLSSSVPEYIFFLLKKKTKVWVPEMFPKSSCIQYGNIRRNFIAYGSKKNSKAMLPLKNDIKLAYLTPDTGLKVNL